MKSRRFHLSADSLFALLAISGALVYLYTLFPFASGYGAYRVTILHFAQTLWKTEEWQHCYLIPIAAAAIIYMDRKALMQIPIKPALTGMGVLLLGLAIYWMGYRVDNIYVGYASFQILIAGLILFFLGWGWMRRLSFPWAFLMFLYPLVFLDNALAFPLRLVMSQASVTVLNFIGVGAVKIGTAIVSAPDPTLGLKEGARFAVDVADPCSGIRSLFALMMVTSLYGQFMLKGVWRKWILFICAGPLAVIGNLGRIMMLTFGTIVMGAEKAIGTLENPTFFHMLAGYIVFAIALVGMVIIAALLNLNMAGIRSVFRSAMRSEKKTSSADTSQRSHQPLDDY